MKRISAAVLLTVFTVLLLTGCYDGREVDDLAYVAAIGLDKGVTNKLKLTLVFAVPSATGGSSENGGGSGEKTSSILTLETPSIMAGLSLANNVVSRQVSIAHAKVIVFSSELAREGISNYINAFNRLRELKPTINMAVARGSAEEYLKSIKPSMESSVTKYFELIYRTYKYTGFTANTSYFKFYKYAKSTFIQPVATLAGITKNESSADFATESSIVRRNSGFPLEGEFKAGEIPRAGDIKADIMGLAVFSGDRMVGELDGEDTAYYLMLRGEFFQSTITHVDPINKDNVVLLLIKQSRNPVHRVELSGGKPVISSKISLEGDIQTIQSEINYESPELLAILEKSVEDFIRKGMEELLQKTAEEYNTDIIGYGAVAKRKFATWQQWLDFDWHKRYPMAEFHVEVDLKIRRPGLLIRTMPIISSKKGSV